MRRLVASVSLLDLSSVAYIRELESALKYIRETPLLSNDEKKRFFKNANTNLGLTALCLSGGATFAYCKIQEVQTSGLAH